MRHREALKDCLPSILQKDTLMNGNDEFMSKEKIRSDCTDCVRQSVCLQIVDLLNNGHYDTAESLMIGRRK